MLFPICDFWNLQKSRIGAVSVSRGAPSTLVNYYILDRIENILRAKNTKNITFNLIFVKLTVNALKPVVAAEFRRPASFSSPLRPQDGAHQRH